MKRKRMNNRFSAVFPDGGRIDYMIVHYSFHGINRKVGPGIPVQKLRKENPCILYTTALLLRSACCMDTVICILI
jgi:hypothetical protein